MQSVPLRGRTHTAIVAALVLLVLLVLGGAAWWWSVSSAAQRTITYVVPAGTSARQAAGEEVELFPHTITIDLAHQDTLVIRNDDSESVVIGPYKIEPGQRFTQHFSNPGTYELMCSIHGSDHLEIVVQ